MPSITYEIISGDRARLIDPEKLPFPSDARVLYIFEDNQIIGRLALLNVLHIEGAWIREDKRNGLILSKLFDHIEVELKNEERTSALSFARENDEDVINYMKRIGYEQLPFKVFLKPLTKE